MSAHISPETRKYLYDLGQARSAPETDRFVEIPESQEKAHDTSVETHVYQSHKDEEDQYIFQTDEEIEESDRKYRRDTESHEIDRDDTVPGWNSHYAPRTIEIILSADSEFFNLLTQELSSIDALQAQQKNILTVQVNDLGKEISAVARPSKQGSQSDMYAWREIFALYRDASVFFASTERDHGARNAAQARDGIQRFTNQLQAQNFVCPFSKTWLTVAASQVQKQTQQGSPNFFPQHQPDSSTEPSIPRNEHTSNPKNSQEVRQTDVPHVQNPSGQLLTSSASSSFPEFMSSDPFFTESLVRGICFVMSENLLSILPQLDDYICPVCASITYRPGTSSSYAWLIDVSASCLLPCLLHPMPHRSSTPEKVPMSVVPERSCTAS